MTSKYQIGDIVKYLTITNVIRVARITGFNADEDGGETFNAKWIDENYDIVEVWGWVSDIQEVLKPAQVN